MQFVVKFITRQRAGGHRDAAGGGGGGESPNCRFLRPLFRRAGTYLRRTLEKASGKISDCMNSWEMKFPIMKAEVASQPRPRNSRNLPLISADHSAQSSTLNISMRRLARSRSVVRGPIPAVCQFMKRFSLSTSTPPPPSSVLLLLFPFPGSLASFAHFAPEESLMKPKS